MPWLYLWLAWRRIGAELKGTNMRSKTKWGAVVAGLGAIAGVISEALSSGGPVPWGQLVPHILTVAGLVLAAIGARDAVGKVGA